MHCMISHCDPVKPSWLHLQGMQVVLLALIRSMPSVAGVVAFGMFEYLVFAIMGVQLFSGKLGSCNSAVSPMPLNPAHCHHGVQPFCSKHDSSNAAVGSLHTAIQGCSCSPASWGPAMLWQALLACTFLSCRPSCP